MLAHYIYLHSSFAIQRLLPLAVNTIYFGERIMPAPLLWLGAGALALIAGAKYESNERMKRYSKVLPGTSKKQVQPVDGAIVSCGVFGVFEHTGIWLDGSIIELKGNGLVRGISPQRFLHDRSGDHIYIACDENDQPLVNKGAANRAVSRLFTYSAYSVLDNNCHKFVWQCVSGESQALTQFSSLNKKLSEMFLTSINWQRLSY